jgi:hypothetical protein
MTQVVECLPGKCEALSSSPITAKKKKNQLKSKKKGKGFLFSRESYQGLLNDYRHIMLCTPLRFPCGKLAFLSWCLGRSLPRWYLSGCPLRMHVWPVLAQVSVHIAMG